MDLGKAQLCAGLGISELGAEVGTALPRAWWVENDGGKGGIGKIWDIQGLGRNLGIFIWRFPKITFHAPKVFENLGC